MCPTFIEKFQAFHKFTQSLHKLRLKILSQFFYPRRITLAVVERLFFSGKFKDLQFPAHHALACLYAFCFLDPLT